MSSETLMFFETFFADRFSLAITTTLNLIGVSGTSERQAGWQAVPPVPYAVLPALSLCRYFNRDEVHRTHKGYEGFNWATVLYCS